MLKQIWKDPVWASVIATGIAAGLGSLGAYLFGYWPAVQGMLTGSWSFLLTKTEVSNWILTLMAIPSAIACFLALALLWSLWSSSSESESSWLTYTTDKFFGLRWRWRYVGGSIDRLVTFCPHCDYQVFPIHASAYAAVDRIEYKCDSCHSHLGFFDETDTEQRSKVERFIQQKIRTDAWKTANPHLP
jgi:hypothetical protein